MSTQTHTPSLVLSDYARGQSTRLRLLDATPTLSDLVGRELAITRMVLAHAYDVPGGRCLVIPADPDQAARPVSNLGWLLRHRDNVRHPLQGIGFTVSTWRYRPHDCMAAGPVPVETFDPVLIAHLADGRAYATQWASPSVLKSWLERPSFQGYLVHWEGRVESATCAIGGADWSALDVAMIHVHPSNRDRVRAGLPVPA